MATTAPRREREAVDIRRYTPVARRCVMSISMYSYVWQIPELWRRNLESRPMPSPFFKAMVDCLPRRAVLLLALLIGALGAAWRPMAAQPLHARQDAAELRIAMAVLERGHGVWCPLHLTDRTPSGHRSPSWHRGTGRRAPRSAGFSPIVTPAGSIPAIDPFIRQPAAPFALATLRVQTTDRSAVSPRAPPSVC